MASETVESTAMSLASRCLLCRKLFVSFMDSDAACCVVPAFSQAAFIASGARSAAPEIRACVASTASATKASMAATRDSASRLTVAIFRSAMPFLTSAIFFATTSSLDCSAVSSSEASFEELSESRFAASLFMARKVFAPPMAVCAAAAAASRASMCLLASSTGISSTPRMKGSSAAWTFSTETSASLTRSSDSLMRASTTSFSERSFMVATVASSLCCASVSRAWSFSTSSFARLDARLSRKREAVLMDTCASAAEASAAFVAFFVASAPPSPPSELSLEPMASAASHTLTTLSSAAATFAAASSRMRLAASFCSTLPHIFLHLATSAWAALSLVWYLMSSALTSVDISLPLDSICRAVMNFFASTRAEFAAFSDSNALSEACRISSEVIEKNFESLPKMLATSVTAFASASALATSASASRIVALFFLAAVARFSSVSFFACASSSPWYSLSLSCASLLCAAVKRLASTSLVAMNIRAMDTAVFAAVEAVSQTLIAANASSKGSSSTPMRKGPSASAALLTWSLTACTLSLASLTSCSKLTFSVTCRCELRRLSMRFSELLARSSSASISAATMPWAPERLWARKRMTAASSVEALLRDSSAAWTVAGAGLSPSDSTACVASSARSHSISTGVNFAMASLTKCCTAWRCWKSWRTVFSGFSLLCASWSCACNLPSSTWARSCTAWHSNCRTRACFALRVTFAWPMAACAALTASSVSATALFTSSTLSPAAWISSEVIAAFSTASSAALHFSCIKGIISSRARESLASAICAFAFCSTWAIAARILPNSAFTCVWAARTAVASCKYCFDISGAALR
mmetsp:Transcript_59208/g.171635  ORF Transcript_59208/g.171635 Transcript_59208/m.171635 type:complete len:818 (+) Transcript_59208:2822-5275(+)